MDGPKQFMKLCKSITWAAIRGHDHFQRSERTRPGRKKHKGPRRERIKLSKYLKHQDGAHATIINAILKETFK